MRNLAHKLWTGKVLALVLAGGGMALAQNAAAQGANQSTQPKIHVNFVNPCHPSSDEAEEMRRALTAVQAKPVFSSDFEISRGVTTLTEAEALAVGAAAAQGPSRWVRVRREFPEKAVLSGAQYSLSAEGDGASEVLALSMRDSKEVLQILISDSVAGTPAQLLRLETPPDRVRIERFGRGSLVLARCPGAEQASYEPLFAAAASILSRYREAMDVKAIVPGEMDRLAGRKESKAVNRNH